MKSILLTTTAIVAFAGAAAADGHTGISFSGDAALGYNDNDTLVTGETDVYVGENGFYWDANIDATMTAALDNGVMASATVGLELLDDELGGDVVSEDYVLSLSTETASLTFGDVDPVAEANYGGVDGDSTTGFFDQDAHFDVVGFDAMLVGEVTTAGVTAMVSHGVFIDATAAEASDYEALDALQVYASGDFGMVSVEAAYQAPFGADDSITDHTVFGLSATAAVAGAELTGAYIANTDLAGVDDTAESSFGLAASYPVGPVTVGGYYSLNDIADDSYGVSADYADGPIAVSAFYDLEGGVEDTDDNVTEIGIEGSYETGLGLTLLAGYITTDFEATDTTSDASYVAGVYDLGGGAELLAVYADDDDDQNDEIGDPEYLPGTTVEVSFSF